MVESTRGFGVVDCVPGSGNWPRRGAAQANPNTNNPNQIAFIRPCTAISLPTSSVMLHRTAQATQSRTFAVRAGPLPVTFRLLPRPLQCRGLLYLSDRMTGRGEPGRIRGGSTLLLSRCRHNRETPMRQVFRPLHWAFFGEGSTWNTVGVDSLAADVKKLNYAQLSELAEEIRVS